MRGLLEIGGRPALRLSCLRKGADGSKNVRGVPDVLAWEEKLANLVSDSIRPRLIPDIEVVPWRKLNVLAVRVYPSNARPHYLERLGAEDGVFIRVGSTNRKADAPQIEELKRLNWRTTFDEQAIPDLKSEAIDFRAASEFFAPYRQLTAQPWSTLRIVTEHQGRQVPTIGGLLLFGKDRFARFPDAWIQAGRFAGSNQRGVREMRLVAWNEDREPVQRVGEDPPHRFGNP